MPRDDLADRLRELERDMQTQLPPTIEDRQVVLKAADQLDRLDAQTQDYEDALRAIARHHDDDPRGCLHDDESVCWDWAQDVARAALRDAALRDEERDEG